MRKPDRPKSSVIFRCAIYTRKSSDDGLEQEFNSLDAQREACEAYVTSVRLMGGMAGGCFGCELGRCVTGESRAAYGAFPLFACFARKGRSPPLCGRIGRVPIDFIH